MALTAMMPLVETRGGADRIAFLFRECKRRQCRKYGGFIRSYALVPVPQLESCQGLSDYLLEICDGLLSEDPYRKPPQADHRVFPVIALAFR